MVHGCIDGATRVITYHECADNNKAATVLEFFRKNCTDVCIPSRVSRGHGMENVDVARFMIENRGSSWE